MGTYPGITVGATLLLGCLVALIHRNRCEGFVVSSPSTGKISELRRGAKSMVLLRSNLSLKAGITKINLDASDSLLEQFKLPMLSLLLSAILVLPANALEASIFTNDYGDPFHPLCKRHIDVSADGKRFHYSGTAVGPKDDPVRRGCTIEEIRKYKLREGAFDGIILSNGKISAGDGIHEGVWEPAGSAKTNIGYEDVDGIRWNDGNKWFVIKTKPKPSKAGAALVFSYIGASALAGIYGIYSTAQRKRQASD
jgi:hypothetical protein